MRKLIRLIFMVIIMVVGIVAIKTGIDTGKQVIYPLRHKEYIYQYANDNELNPYLVMGLIKAESNYIHDAHSGVARGLMQITDDTAKWISEKMNLKFSTEDIEDPETNIKMGCYYLRYLINYYKEVDVALAAYNGGMGNVDKWLANKEYSKDGKTLVKIPFTETSQYVERVNKYQQIYKDLYPDDLYNK